MRFFGKTDINFVEFRNKAFIISLVVILIGLGSLLIRGGPDLGIDFEGGTLVQIMFDKAVPINDLRGVVRKAGYENANIQEFGQNNEYLIKVEEIKEGRIAAAKLLGALNS